MYCTVYTLQGTLYTSTHRTDRRPQSVFYVFRDHTLQVYDTKFCVNLINTKLVIIKRLQDSYTKQHFVIRAFYLLTTLHDAHILSLLCGYTHKFVIEYINTL